MGKNIVALLAETEIFTVYDGSSNTGWSLLNAMLVLASALLAVYFTASWIKGKSLLPKAGLSSKDIVLRQAGVYLCLAANVLLFIFTSGGFVGAPSVINNFTVIIISFLVVEVGFILISPQTLPQ